MDAEVIIIGAGAIGLSIAERFAREGLSCIVLEKEKAHGTGVSSRSSEVIHAGIYYKTGSLKAALCLRGKTLLYEYCIKNKIDHKRTGKLFVASKSAETEKLELTKKQGVENGVDDLIELDERGLKRMEPDVSGVAALFSPSSGIFDSHGFMNSLLRRCRGEGAIFAFDSPVLDAEPVRDGWRIKVGDSSATSVTGRTVVNAAGLYATFLSKTIFPCRNVPELYPTKGSYARFSGSSPVEHIIYPALLPGTIEERVDATPDLGGGLRFGPNVEITDSVEDFNVDQEVAGSMIKNIKKYLPDIDTSRIRPDFAGIRPKIYKPGEPVQDFRFEWAAEPGWLDLWGIESPGLTASLAIAEYVYGLIEDKGILA